MTTEADVFGWMIAIVSFLFGLFLGAKSAEFVSESERDRHDKTTKEQGEEIARLRAQVALWIGTEKK